MYVIFYMLVDMRKSNLKLILTKLLPYRDLAEEFLLILEETTDEDKDFIDKLYGDIMQNIKEIKSKDQLQKISNELKRIKEKELIEDSKDKQDLEDLESLIDNIE